jgi:hypothetical protein
MLSGRTRAPHLRRARPGAGPENNAVSSPGMADGYLRTEFHSYPQAVN